MKTAFLTLCVVCAVAAVPAVAEEVDADATIRAQIAAGEWIDASLGDPWGWSYELDCPLRLSLEVPSALPDERWGSMHTRRFRCNSRVSVAPVAISPEYRRGALERVDVVLQVKVDPPILKPLSERKFREPLRRVHLRCELLLDGKPSAQALNYSAEVEEGKSKRIDLPLSFAPGALERWAGGVEHARLRVYVSAVDN